MKKFTVIALALLALVSVASAQMDQEIISVSSATITTNTGTGVVKGEIYSIRLDSTANKTQAVTIVTAEGETLLSVAALTADATYYPLASAHRASTGAAIEESQTATGTNSVWVRQAVASDLTMTVTPAAATTGTNVTRAIITFKK
jgi:hypothetical protein